MIKNFLFISGILCHIHTQSHAQESVLSSGGNAASSSGTVSYSIGQTVYNRSSSAAYSLTQGVQQPFEISIVTSEKSQEAIEVNVFPNPSSQSIQLMMQFNESKVITYQLSDVAGKLLETKSVTENISEINLASYASSIFFLKVISAGKELKTFKILKK